MRRSNGRRPAAVIGPATDRFAVAAVAASAAIERASGSGMWNEGEQAEDSRHGRK